MPRKNIWTLEEDNFVKNNYCSMTCEEIAKHLGRTNRSINHRLKHIGLDNYIPSAGDRFNDFTIQSIDTENKKKIAICKCKCGVVKNIIISSPLYKSFKDCGCKLGNTKIKHGKTQTRLYTIWHGIKKRCCHSNCKFYKDYGNRGIQMYEKWKDDFLTFYEWSIQNGYKEEFSIDRINVHGNYEPNNCRWTDRKTQNRNKRNSVILTAFDETKNISDWLIDERCQVKSTNALYNRIKKGMSIEEALVAKNNIQYKNGHKHRLRNIRRGIITRCTNPKSSNYHRYGGRGIKVCEEWKNSLASFREWAMNNGYQDHLSLDRIDNDGDYCPENCRWASVKEQSCNTIRTYHITAFGETKTISDWGKDPRCKVSRVGLKYRLQHGWEPELAMTTPKLCKKLEK